MTLEEIEALPLPPENERGAYLRRYCFALYREHNSEVDNPNLKTGTGRIRPSFREDVRHRFGVKSRATMTVSNWHATLDAMKDEIQRTEPGHYLEATDVD